MRSRRPPARALASTVLRSRAVSENSAQTNTAVPSVSMTKPSTASTVSATLIGTAPYRPAARDPFHPSDGRTSTPPGSPNRIATRLPGSAPGSAPRARRLADDLCERVCEPPDHAAGQLSITLRFVAGLIVDARGIGTSCDGCPHGDRLLNSAIRGLHTQPLR